MKPYLDILKRIRDEGYNHVDRTGTGRRSIVGVEVRHKMSLGFPLVTTRQVFSRGMIEEILFFIRGQTDNSILEEKGVKIWSPWAVTEDHIKAFAKKYNNDDPAMEEAMRTYYITSALGQIGPMYGAQWRNAPRDYVDIRWPKVTMDEIPSDKKVNFIKEYEELRFINGSKSMPPLEDFCSNRYYSTCDQLNELIRTLKKKPFSSRLLVSAWVPEHVPFEELSPQENVLLGRGALAACHAFFQCFVKPAAEEGGKKQLSLLVYQR